MRLGLRKIFPNKAVSNAPAPRQRQDENAAKTPAMANAPQNVVDVASTPLTKQIFVISFIANLMGLAMPLAIFQVYDRILPNQASPTLFWLIAGLLVAVILDLALRGMRSYILGWAAMKNSHRAQQLAISQLLNAPSHETSKISRTKWLDGLDAIAEYSAFQGSQNRTILIDIPMAFIFLGVVAMVGGILVVVPIVLIIAFALFSYLQGNEIQNFLDKRSQQDNRQNEFLMESFVNIQTVKSLAVESQLLRRFELLQKTSTLSSYDAIISTNKLQTQGVLFSNLMMVCVVSFGAIRVVGGDMSLAALACCSLLTGRMVQPFTKALTLFHELQNVRLAKSRCDIFNNTAAADLHIKKNADLKLKIGTLVVRDVKMKSTDKITTQAKFSFSAQKGEFIGIHCQETPERSELVDLIRGRSLPQEGGIFADGFSSKQWHELGISNEIGFVSAKSEILEGSIIDNITMFGSSNQVEQAREAARIIGLEQDIFRLPDGYDTMLSIGSASVLSPGLLQRIKIARVLMQRPKILIFDGANTHMDMRSDKLLSEGLLTLKGNMTAIFFSSRPSFLKIADQKFHLEDDRLTPDEEYHRPQQDTPARSASQ